MIYLYIYTHYLHYQHMCRKYPSRCLPSSSVSERTDFTRNYQPVAGDSVLLTSECEEKSPPLVVGYEISDDVMSMPIFPTLPLSLSLPLSVYVYFIWLYSYIKTHSPFFGLSIVLFHFWPLHNVLKMFAAWVDASAFALLQDGLLDFAPPKKGEVAVGSSQALAFWVTCGGSPKNVEGSTNIRW